MKKKKKKSEKSLEPFLRKLRDQPTNQPIITNNTDLIRPPWRWSNNLKISFIKFFIWFIWLSVNFFFTMFDIYRMPMNYTLRFVLLILFIRYFITAQECTILYILEMPVHLSEGLGSVGVFNYRKFSVQSKVSHSHFKWWWS